MVTQSFAVAALLVWVPSRECTGGHWHPQPKVIAPNKTALAHELKCCLQINFVSALGSNVSVYSLFCFSLPRLILSAVESEMYIRRLLWVIYRVESLGRKSGRYILCSVCKFGGLLRFDTLILKQTSCGNFRYILIEKLGFIKSGRLLMLSSIQNSHLGGNFKMLSAWQQQHGEILIAYF